MLRLTWKRLDYCYYLPLCEEHFIFHRLVRLYQSLTAETGKEGDIQALLHKSE